MTSEKIAERGSLNLLKDPNGTLLVQLRDQQRRVDTLSTAARWFSVDGVKLNGSQVGTVKAWVEEFGND